MLNQNEKSYKLINEVELKRFRLSNPKMDDLEVMTTLTAQLAQQLRQWETQRCLAMAKDVEPLKCFTGLRPTEEEIRQALIKVIHMPHPEDSKRKLIYCKSHWLAIMRALQFLGVVSTDYGAKKEFEMFINRLLRDVISPFDCRRLYNIEAESPFNRPLVDWYHYSLNPRLKTYWAISITFLECIANTKKENLKDF